MPPARLPLNSSDPRSGPKHSSRPGSARSARATRPSSRSRRPEGKFKQGDYSLHSTGARHICVLLMFDELCCPVCAPPQQAPNIDLESRANLFIGTLRSTPAVTTRCYYSRGMMNPTSLSQRRFTLRPSGNSCKQAWRRK